MNRPMLLMYLLIWTLMHLHAQDENFNILDHWVEYSNGENMLQLYLNQQSYELLDQRDEKMAGLQSKEDWENRKKEVNETYRDIVGTFPEKTPLNARVIGVLKREDFKVEKIIFESMPGFHVTGSLFIPNRLKGKHPAILYVSGHTELAYKYPNYQHVIINLVKKGFVVFAIDPVGQGERLQYFDPETGKSAVGGPTTEHSYPGLQCFLAGESVNKYFIWDGIRAIDYLHTRKEVDTNRLGVTGRSGGGTQSVFISAFDERIKAAAPENYVTSHRRLLQTRGPQDGEQNYFHWLASGVALEDLLIMRMPKPLLLVTTTRDIFSIQGAREVYEEVSRGYQAFGLMDNLTKVEDDAGHSSTKSNNEAIYKFFRQHLSFPGDTEDEEIVPFEVSELMVTSTGQMSTSIDGESVFSLNKMMAEELNKVLNEKRKSADYLEQVKGAARTLSGFEAPGNPEYILDGCYQREGYRICMYILKGPGEAYVVPLLMAIPDGDGPKPAIVSLHPEGKEKGIELTELINQGYIVVAPDLIGVGETKPAANFGPAPAFGAMILGKSMVGNQASDIVNVVNFLKDQPIVDAENIQAIAFEEQVPALLHAAAFDTSIKGVALVDGPESYYSVTQERFYDLPLSFSWGVAGALRSYDLPDLEDIITGRNGRVIKSNPDKEPELSEVFIDLLDR
ncbi:MAG: acetylxylan esterase [Cyclobacteriaceae bacterium]